MGGVRCKYVDTTTVEAQRAYVPKRRLLHTDDTLVCGERLGIWRQPILVGHRGQYVGTQGVILSTASSFPVVARGQNEL